MIPTGDGVTAEISMPGCQIVSLLRPKIARPSAGYDCLCDALRAIDALEARHCTFEMLFSESGAKQLAQPGSRSTGWEEGLKYLRLTQTDNPAQRTYQVCRVHERRRFEGRAEVQLVEIPTLKLRITSQPTAGRSPEFLGLTYFLGGREWLPLGYFPVEASKYPLYDNVNCVLTRALDYDQERSCVADRLRDVDANLRAAAGLDISSQFLKFIESLTRKIHNNQALDQRIYEVQQRLWDAPVLDDHGVTRLEESLHNRSTFAEQLIQLDIDTQINVLRALESPNERDLTDQFVGAIKLAG